METKNQKKTENTGSKVQSAVNAQRPSIPNPVKESKTEAVKTDAEPNAEIKKTEEPKKAQEQPKQEIATPKAEQLNGEAKPTLKVEKPALNLEGTLKLVEELHRRKVQRDRLLDTINNLEAFEIAQKEDAEQTDSNHFQGCTLTIQDDKNRTFTTKNPVIIFSVAQYVNSMCVNRLAEIEAGITIPA